MSFPSRADRRRRRHPRLRIIAALGLIAGSFLVRPGASGAEQDPGPAEDLKAATEEACAGVSATLTLIGSSSAKEALTAWAPEICARTNIVADYTDFGSKGGREAVTPADAAVIGLTSLPFSATEQAALKEQKRGIVLVPFLSTAVACTYWDTNPFDPATSGSRYPNLRISRRTLADQLGGSPVDGTNASADLAADNEDNPDFKGGPPYLNIEPWFRSGYSAVAYRLTEWFAQDEQAKTSFLKGSLLGYELPFEDIGTPDGSSPQLVNDYATMKSRMTGAQQSLGLGCMDNASARTDVKPSTPEVEPLNIAWLDNTSGAFVAPTEEAVTAATEAMTPNADGTFTPDWEVEDPKAYPLPLLVYAAMPTCGIDATTRTQMDKVMTYAIGAGQTNLPEGNYPLPSAQSATATRQLESWRKLSATAAPCTPATTTTTSTTSTTQPGGTTTTTVEGEGAYVPPAATGGSGGGGVYADPANTGAIPGGSGPTSGAVPTAAPTTVGAAPVEAAPVTPMRRIVAVATGSQAVPPAAMLLSGSGLLLAGPVLQIFGGLKRAGTLPALALAWFTRLKP